MNNDIKYLQDYCKIVEDFIHGRKDYYDSLKALQALNDKSVRGLSDFTIIKTFIPKCGSLDELNEDGEYLKDRWVPSRFCW